MDPVTTNQREKWLLRQVIARLIDIPKQTGKHVPTYLIDDKEPTDRRCGIATATGARLGK